MVVTEPVISKKSHLRRNLAILVVVILVGFTLIGILSALSTFTAFSPYPVYNAGSFGIYLENPGAPAPKGLGAFGLESDSGTIKPYVVTTDEVVAEAEIRALGAFNASLPGQFRYGANLQLNAMLMVNTSSSTQAFWLQDTVRFNTRTLFVDTPRDLVFNLTRDNS